ncbi:unnamed protein product [Symbiodinium pilosum]|uniref:Uncharacterized protein n=1 Tax=Symbiodinium pilosum TaxID=2952 RepID=A0A812PJK6_SYMPI|nr:unnamed protein product [Symbiodinium pilosum]
MLQEVRGLTEDELYERLTTWEDGDVDSALQQRQHAESTLRGEVTRLLAEVSRLQQESASAKQKAMSAELVQFKSAEKMEAKISLARRQLQSIARGMGAASGLAERCRYLQRQAEVLFVQQDALSKDAKKKKQALEDCSREVRELSHRLEIAEKDPQGAATTGWVSGAAFEAPSSEVDLQAETASLLAERSALRQSMHKQKEMVELQQLLADERMLLEKRRMSAADMLREIADLEEQADDVERNSQRVIGEMRSSLERLASQVDELRRAKDQAEDWLGAVWAALNQQRREQLLLHQRVKEEDDWASRLQDRTEALVVELQVLERETHAQRLPEAHQEKDALRTLAYLQQSRKHARQTLSRQLASSRHVQGSLKEAESQQISLLERLSPVKPMLQNQN